MLFRTVSLVLALFLAPLAASAALPVAIADAYATTENTTLTVAAPGLIANDYDPDGDSFILSNFVHPSNGTLTSIVTNGSFVYVPNPGFVGTDTFVYIARDANNEFSDPATVTIHVVPDPNRPPVGIPDNYGTPAGTPLTVAAPGLIANDFDPDGDSFILSNFAHPLNGTLTSIVTNGSFVYVPDPGFAGTDTFVYIARDAKTLFSDSVTVTIEVVPPGDSRPIAIADAYNTTENTTLTVAAPGLIANDYDPDGDSFILSNFVHPSNGTLTSIVTNGSFVYVPNPGFVGTDTFVYIARDANNEFSDPATVTIHVVPDPNRPPVAIPDNYGTPAGTPLTVAAPGLIANDFDPDGDSFILSNFVHPSNGTLTSIVTNGSFVYVPDPGFIGVDSFTYIDRDAKGAFSSSTKVTLVVGDAEPPPRLCDPNDDGTVDIADIQIILAARNQPADGPGDPRDADGDGTITVLDARQCVLQCTLAGCAVP